MIKILIDFIRVWIGEVVKLRIIMEIYKGKVYIEGTSTKDRLIGYIDLDNQLKSQLFI